MGVMDSKATNLMLQNFSGRPKEQVNNNKILKEMFQKEEKKAEIKSEIKIIYPTADYIINQTHGGVDFANPLFLRKKQFYDIKFNRDVLHKFEGSDNYCWHTGCIPHIKVFILTNEKMEINDDSIIYIGSHNLSKAAWGSMEKNQQ